MYNCCNIVNEFNVESLYTFFKQTFRNNYSFEGEEHNFWEVVCVTKGSVGVTANADLYILRKGQCVIHKPGEFHNLWPESKDAEAIIFSFDGDLPEFKNRVYNMTEADLKEIYLLYSETERCFDINGQELNSVLVGRERAAQTVVKKIELFMLSVMSNDEADDLDIKSKSAINYMNIVSVLGQHIGENINIKDIADICNISESSVKKIFKKYSGVGIIHYFNALKVKKAQSMLESGYSVKETAESLGFTDQNYFSVFFKRATGIPPVKYKKSILEKF